jgi:deoxycytidylate deaminase
VITAADYRAVLSIGYNGNASGLPNRCDSDEVGACGCLHSEENALIHCDSPRQLEKVVFVTHLPCSNCAKRMINLGGIIRILFKHDYRRRESVQILKAVGIPLFQLVGSEARPITE